MENIFYDITPFMLSDLESEKSQVIIFKIVDYKHIPLVAFCYEEVLDNAPDSIMEYVEIYHPGIVLNRVDRQIYINGNVQGIFQDCKFFIYGDPCIPYKQTRFNDFHYLERTLTDRVDILEQINKQLIEQIKIIKKSVRQNIISDDEQQ